MKNRSLSHIIFSTIVGALLLLSVNVRAQSATPNYQDLWWGGTAESGWGASITQQGNALFTVLYIYDNAGKPQWVVMSGGQWNAAKTAYTGDVYIPTGTYFAAYDANKFVPGAAVGSATMTFSDTSNATLSYIINGVSGTKNISRNVFGTGSPTNNYTNIWWGGQNQSGWGLSITQQGAVMFGVWYTYDMKGKTTWYVMPSITGTNGAYSGKLYSTTGAPWIGVPYDASKFKVAEVGSVDFTFTGNAAANMKFNVESITGTHNIVPLIFAAEAVEKSSFAQLQELVIEPQCNSCHADGKPFAIQSGLVLDAKVAYKNLINAPVKDAVGIAHGMKQVVPGKPEESFLYTKLILWDPKQLQHFGSPMPLGTRSLSVGQLDFVKKWILAGAPETGIVVDAALLKDSTAPSYSAFSPLVPPAKGYQLKIDAFTVAPNFEREFFIYKGINNPATIYVSKIETRMRNNSHHFLLHTFRSDTPGYILPPANVIRDIRNTDGSMNFINMVAMGYHVFLAGSMTPEGGYTFPPGYALKLPANTMLDLNSHYVNKGTSNLTGEAYANLHTIEASEVRQVVQTLDLGNTNIPLPAGQRTTHSKTFTFSSPTRVLMLTSHMHKLGERFIIKIKGGARDGEVVYENTDWEHPKITTFSPVLTLQAGEGLTSVITYNNTTKRNVNFGLTSEDEMGIIFGYYY